MLRGLNMATINDLAVKMMEKGIDIGTVGEILDVPVDELVELRDSLDIIIGRDDVTEALNRLAWDAYNEAKRLLKTGNPSVKLRLIAMMISNMRGMMGSQSPKQMQELVDQFKSAIEMHEDDPEMDEDAAEDIPEDLPV